MKKVDIIFNWLKQGERLVKMGKADGLSNYIVKHGNNFAYSRFGSSAVKATKKDLSWLLTEIFDPDDEFYIITDDGKMLTTNKLTDTACNVAYTFTLYARDIFTYKETPLQQFRGNFAKVLKTYVQIAECYNDQHKENHVHFALSCENPFFNYWNFAI